MDTQKEVTETLNPSLKAFKESYLYKDLAKWINSLEDVRFMKIKSSGKKEIVSMKTLRTAREDGTKYELLVRYRSTRHTLKYTSKTTAIEMKKEVTEMVIAARSTAVRGHKKFSSEKPWLNRPLSGELLEFIIYANKKGLNASVTDDIRAFSKILSNSKHSAITLGDFFDTLSIGEILDDLYEVAKSQTKPISGKVKCVSFFKFVGTHVFNSFKAFLKKNLKKNLSSEEFQLYQVSGGLFNESYAGEVEEFVKSNKPQPKQRQKTKYTDPNIYYDKIFSGLVNSKDIGLQDIRVGFLCLLNIQLGFRQGELLSARPEDIEVFDDGTGSITLPGSISRRGGGFVYLPDQNKKNDGTAYHRPLNQDCVRIFRILLHPIFSYDLKNTFSPVLDRSKDQFRLDKGKGKSSDQKRIAFEVPRDKPLGEWLIVDGGFELINAELNKRKLKFKRQFIYERFTSAADSKLKTERRPTLSYFVSPPALSRAHKTLCEKLDIAWKPGHSRFRKDLTTKFFIDNGATLDSKQQWQRWMQWETPSMVDTYLAEISTDKIKDVLGRDSNSSASEPSKESVINKMLSGTPLSELSPEEKILLEG